MARQSEYAISSDEIPALDVCRVLGLSKPSSQVLGSGYCESRDGLLEAACHLLNPVRDACTSCAPSDSPKRHLEAPGDEVGKIFQTYAGIRLVAVVKGCQPETIGILDKVPLMSFARHMKGLMNSFISIKSELSLSLRTALMTDWANEIWAGRHLIEDVVMPGFGKRKDETSGRRSAVRAPVLLSAEMKNPLDSEMTELLSISETGARFRGLHLPSAGQHVLIRFESVEAFGTVVWSKAGTCGIHFDEPLAALELRHLARVGGQCKRANMNPDQRLAAQAWMTGFAR